MAKIKVQNTEITIVSFEERDYIVIDGYAKTHRKWTCLDREMAEE